MNKCPKCGSDMAYSTPKTIMYTCGTLDRDGSLDRSARCMKDEIGGQKAHIISSVETVSETWRDPKTGLEWQAVPPKRTMDWKKAQAYAKALDLHGGGWRLPTENELVTVSGGNRPRELCGVGDWYWSSSPVEDDGGRACYAGFHGGFVPNNVVHYDVHVRCVR